MDDYSKGLNNSSIYKNDLLQAERDFEKITEFDPKCLTEITGGIIGIVSPTGCGKSYLLRDILSKIHKHYDSIHIMCPTAAIQDCYDYFPKENISNFFDEKLLEDIYTEQMTQKKGLVKKPLIILDDVIGEPAYDKSIMLNKIATAGRPLSITVILLSQYFSKIKPLHRTNLRAFIGFDIDNCDELDKFTNSFMCSVNKRCGRLLYKKITGEHKYQCCVVLIHKNYVGTDEKVKKYIGDPNVKKFKIKSIKNTQNGAGHLHTCLPECLPDLFYN